MDPTLLAIIIKNFGVPLIASVIRAHQNATGSMPTDAQIIAALPADVAAFDAIGQAFLDAKRATIGSLTQASTGTLSSPLTPLSKPIAPPTS